MTDSMHEKLQGNLQNLIFVLKVIVLKVIVQTKMPKAIITWNAKS